MQFVTGFVGLSVGLSLLTGVQAWWWSSDDPTPEWDNLRVTFRLWSGTDELPRTVQEATTNGWVKNTATCSGSVHFRGIRYIKDDDTAVMLLFDVNGYIAGMQAGLPKDEANVPTGRMRTAFVEEQNMYTATVYFVPPDTICSVGRSLTKYEAEGTGTQLLFQIGPNPSNLLSVPMTEEEVKVTDPWVEGRCFPRMGKHYWYNFNLDMTCDDTLPFFLLYNGGKLNAFGWTFYGDLQSSRYEERPVLLSAQVTMDVVPRCIERLFKDGNTPNLRTMHVYLTNSYNFC